jgi:hypothetical protein
MGSAARRKPNALSGGGGLVASAADYHLFTQMLLGRGEYAGVRLLGSRTVDYMTRNHLPGGADLESFGRPLHAEMPLRGAGFGLGFSVILDPAAAKNLGSAGEYAWGGAARPRSGLIRPSGSQSCSSPSCCRPPPIRSAHSYVSSSTRRWWTRWLIPGRSVVVGGQRAFDGGVPGINRLALL